MLKEVYMSRIKVETAATNAVRNLINLSNCMTSDEIKEGDRGISFDGYVPIYLKNDIKKENFYNKVDIQVKGRSVEKLSSAKQLRFSMSLNDVKNYKNVGGTIIFYVQVNNNRKKCRIYVKSLLPYEINRILRVNNNKNVPLLFEYIDENDVNRLEFIFFQFQSDKDKQYSYKNEYKTIEDFEKENGTFKLGINIPSISVNPIDYLDMKSFIYFKPDKYDNMEIPCGIAKLSSYVSKKNTNVKIGGETMDTTFEIKQFSDYIILNINDCIFYNSNTNLFTFDLNSKLSTALYNIELIKKFIKYETINIEKSVLSIKSGGDYSFLEYQMKIIQELNLIVKALNIDIEPIINFKDTESVKNIELIYNNVIDKKGVPFKNNYDAFLLNIHIFNLTIAFLVQIRSDKSYDLFNFYDVLINKKDLFCCTNDKNEQIIIFPNFSVLNKKMKLNVMYLIADNIVDKLFNLDMTQEKVLNNVDLEANLTSFILDGLDFYDHNIENFRAKYLLNFLEKVSKSLLETNNKNCKYIFYINYCQVLKRLNKLDQEKMKELILIRDNTEDIMAKVCTSILLEDQNGFNIYHDKLNEEQKESLKAYPIININV